ncbi:MAG: helix-turn-helix transcriptional regulator [Candidatus Binatia bacterium]|nr:helix-turn-helix transcriptional regulator [Candidatus Binatia bacterium]
MTEEREYWARLIQELQNIGIGLERIAEALGVSERQVSNWKSGQRPTGMTAVRLIEFHGEHRRVLHVQAKGTGIAS